ncbi:MAG: 1-deoxy-D-xylulose-5-phosphate synthase [Ruminococcaceae bacterium]|nr:1-deoxy-D-xylulose-5-phosphate synthase [Oscillospiraceae bacterium]
MINSENATILPTIRHPDDIKRLSLEEMTHLCGEIRSFLQSSVRVTGGHLASNLGIVELSCALVYTLDFTCDKLVYDVGHQCYTHKLLTGRYADFDSLRSFGGLSGFQSPNESIFDFFQTGHASTSISAVIGFARAAKLRGEKGCFVAVCGDGSLTGGMVYEALNDGGDTDLPIVVIINDNEMSIGKSVGVIPHKLSALRLKKGYIRAKRRYHLVMDHLPRLSRFLNRTKEKLKDVLLPHTILDEFGFDFLGTVDGNDLTSLIHALQYAKAQNHPVLLHARTIKGLGDKPSVSNPEKYHSVPRELPDTTPSGSFSKEFGKELVKLGAEEPSLCVITAAMPKGTGTYLFGESYPDRYFDVGIAEEHAVTMAGALSMGGMNPVVAIYSTFLQRSFDQLLNDVALQNSTLHLAIDRCGIACDDGMTHNGIYDVGYLSLIPGLSLYAPSNFAELRDMLRFTVKEKGLTAVRYAKGGEGEFKANCFTGKEPFVELGDPGDYVILSYGIAINKAISVANSLKNEGISVSIIKLNRLFPFETESLLSALSNRSGIFVIEDVVREGSIGEKLAFLLLERGIHTKYRAFALPGIIPHGDLDSLEKLIGFDNSTIIHSIREAISHV